MKNDDLLNRGERLKEERRRLGINTQDELAEIMNVKKNSVGWCVMKSIMRLWILTS